MQTRASDDQSWHVYEGAQPGVNGRVGICGTVPTMTWISDSGIRLARLASKDYIGVGVARQPSMEHTVWRSHRLLR